MRPLTGHITIPIRNELSSPEEAVEFMSMPARDGHLRDAAPA